MKQTRLSAALASRDPFDAAKLAIFQYVPHEQEILLVTHLRDNARVLSIWLRMRLGSPCPAISAMRAFDGQTTQETPGLLPSLGY
jgi:hypothetical protein